MKLIIFHREWGETDHQIEDRQVRLQRGKIHNLCFCVCTSQHQNYLVHLLSSYTSTIFWSIINSYSNSSTAPFCYFVSQYTLHLTNAQSKGALSNAFVCPCFASVSMSMYIYVLSSNKKRHVSHPLNQFHRIWNKAPILTLHGREQC